jgi:rhamnose utilization protein RhaD (predicted bifunctional aldolase and dehydrogenase)/NAD(P)-dependent dehydrogenase (short-subunit alcohol dehydrogenase family)
MDSQWSDADADRMVDRYTAKGYGPDMALRVYTTRLLGRDPGLVLHGGGNTSVKTVATDLLGAEVGVLRVKGSGWDMADIEPPGLPAVRLDPLRRLRHLDALTDEDMVAFERQNLLDSGAPNPSVETLLHAFLPHKFVDHTHSTAVLSLTNQPDGEALCRDLFNDSVGVVPYIMPGFDLAKSAAEVFEGNSEVRGLVLLKHGVFTFGETARDAYEEMVGIVTRVEARLAGGRKRVFPSAAIPRKLMSAAEVAPILRGACAIGDKAAYDGHRRFVLDFRSGPAILSYVNGSELERYSQSGVATPDHTIRTKNWPMLLPAPKAGDAGGFDKAVADAVAGFAERYRAYFTRNAARHVEAKTELDPMPRVVLVPGLGLFGLGRTAADARIAADVAVSTVETITAAESIGKFESAVESDLFDIEYWSLEQAKLGRAEKTLAGCVILVTGGSGTIGTAICRAFADEGVAVAVVDLDAGAAEAVAGDVGGGATGIGCDVTDPGAVRAAFDRACTALGGVDIVVSNAGAAWRGKIGEVPDDVLRKSFELNFFAHQTVAQNAVRVMRAQGTGGVLLFNVSKQAVNPGSDFGPYGVPKAATLSLVRQYALDHGSEGIRANAVNADRIRGGLLTDNMIASRARARGVSEGEYMSGNLLGTEVTAADVAQAFVHQALATKTTANVTTVDGGNISAVLR